MLVGFVSEMVDWWVAEFCQTYLVSFVVAFVQLIERIPFISLVWFCI